MKHFFEIPVPVNLIDTAASLLQDLGRESLIHREVFEKMSTHKEFVKNITLFAVSTGTVSDVDAEEEFAKYNLVPANPILVLAFNKLRPDFSDIFPHWTHWKNDADVWCVMDFRVGILSKKREVRIAMNNFGWNHSGLLAGMRP